MKGVRSLYPFVEMTSISVKPVEAAYAEKLDKIFGKKDSLVEYNPGRCLLPTTFEDVAQKVLDADVREDDLWFISFPRTGLFDTFTKRKWSGG